jgi:hypothetical protein
MPAWVVFVAVIVGTGQLCLGIWIGIGIGRLQKQRSRLIAQRRAQGRSKNTVRAETWDQCTSRVDDLSQRVESLSAASANYEPKLTETFLAAVAQLTEAAAALQRQIHDAREILVAKTPAEAAAELVAAASFRGRAGVAGEPAGLTAAELLELAKQPGGGAGSVQKQRFPYVALQYMARCTEHELPTSADFQPVQCNDLSVNGVSFFREQSLDCEFLVISVGVLGDPLFVLCRVRYSRKVVVHDSPRHLIGCEFIRRLPPGQFDWEQVSRERTLATV